MYKTCTPADEEGDDESDDDGDDRVPHVGHFVQLLDSARIATVKPRYMYVCMHAFVYMCVRIYPGNFPHFIVLLCCC